MVDFLPSLRIRGRDDIQSSGVFHQITTGRVCNNNVPIAFLGSFALAALALQSTFQEHGESLGLILRDVELGGLHTHQALCATRNELHPKAREVLPPFDVFVTTPSP